jgi:hypothetical protein
VHYINIALTAKAFKHIRSFTDARYCTWRHDTVVSVCGDTLHGHTLK